MGHDPDQAAEGHLRPAAARRSGCTRGATAQSIVLTVPVTFPPEEIEHGAMLAGLPLPDSAARWARSLLGDRSQPFEEGNTEFGGILKRLVFEGMTGPDPSSRARRIRSSAGGAGLRAKRPPAHRGGRTRIAELASTRRHPLAVHRPVGQGRQRRDVEHRRPAVALKTGEWSGWIDLDSGSTRSAARHDAVLPGPRRTASCSSTPHR